MKDIELVIREADRPSIEVGALVTGTWFLNDANHLCYKLNIGYVDFEDSELYDSTDECVNEILGSGVPEVK